MTPAQRTGRVARPLLALASVAFIFGVVMIVLGYGNIGDALMIGGGALLLAGAGLLAWSGKPKVDDDAR